MRVKAVLGLFLMVLLLASPALATITITWNDPPANTTYNNLQANRETIDLNFTYSDDNTSTLNDFNVTIRVLRADYTTHTTLLSDMNVFDANANPTANLSCTVLDSKVEGTCHYHWTMPLNSVLSDGEYHLDVNITEYLRPEPQISVDDNAMRDFTVFTKLSTGQVTRDLMAIVGVVLAAIVLLTGLAAVVFFKTDVTYTAIVTVVAAVAVAIASQIIGTVLIPI